MQAAYNWNGNNPARFCVDLSPFLTQTVELTSNGHQLTSQGGSVAEEGRDKDQCIKNDLSPCSQKFEELPTEFWIAFMIKVNKRQAGFTTSLTP